MTDFYRDREKLRWPGFYSSRNRFSDKPRSLGAGRAPGLLPAALKSLSRARRELFYPTVKEKWTKLLPALLMLVFALSRIPGVLPQNFSAAYALAFCGGVYFTGAMAWWLPLGTLFATDVLLNVCYYHEPVFSGYMLVKTLSFAALIGLGRLFSPRTNWWKLLGGGLLGAVLFYFITNTASWLHNPEYAKTLAGWLQALTTGLPNYPSTWEFFRNTLLSGGLFTGLFVGAMKATAESPAEKTAGAREKEPENEETPEEAKA